MKIFLLSGSFGSFGFTRPISWHGVILFLSIFVGGGGGGVCVGGGGGVELLLLCLLTDIDGSGPRYRPRWVWLNIMSVYFGVAGCSRATHQNHEKFTKFNAHQPLI